MSKLCRSVQTFAYFNKVIKQQEASTSLYKKKVFIEKSWHPPMKSIVNCDKLVWLLLELFSLDFFTQTFVCLTAQEM